MADLTARLLRVNLTDQTTSIEDVPANVVRTWVGGREVFRDGRLDESVRGEAAIFDHARGGYWATQD